MLSVGMFPYGLMLKGEEQSRSLRLGFAEN
jgi:hypothetical protein